jgi:hypothetical protein
LNLTKEFPGNILLLKVIGRERFSMTHMPSNTGSHQKIKAKEHKSYIYNFEK